MNAKDAQERLGAAGRATHDVAQRGARQAAVLAATLVTAVAVVVDLDMLWLLGLVALGYVGLSVARPVKLRFDWSDRAGVAWFVAGIAAVVAAYLLMQWWARSADWGIPNTSAALVAAGVILLVCLPAMVRLATPRDGVAAATTESVDG